MAARHSGQERRQHIEEMSTYLAFKRVPPRLVKKVLDFYEYYNWST